MPGPQAAILPDGRRLHLQHGPIDLIIGADGPGREAAMRAAIDRFATLLQELVDELPLLRTAVPPAPGLVPLTGRVARAMLAAVRPFAPDFVTPMAAVAGAVADEILARMCAAGGLRRAYVNNGGDVALHLAHGETLRAAIAAGLGDGLVIAAESPVRGVATSGWRGRSHSLGIADSVTVLAGSAAAADAAATMIANRVDLPDSARVTRVPACELSPDSDLGQLPVTVDVAPLAPAEIAAALDRGAGFAETCRTRGLIHAALITLAGERRIVGHLHPQEPAHA